MTSNPDIPATLSVDRSPQRAAGAIALMLLVAIIYLRWQGRVWWCRAGDWFPISFVVNSPHNSQHLLDAYSLSHALHDRLHAVLVTACE